MGRVCPCSAPAALVLHRFSSAMRPGSRFGRLLEEVGWVLSCTYTPRPHHQLPAEHQFLGQSHPSPLLSPSLLHLLPHSTGSLPTALGHQPSNEIELSPSRSRGQLFKVEWQQAWELFMGSGQLGSFSRPRREEYFYISSPHDRRTSHLSVAHQPRCAFLCQNCSKYLVPGIQFLV